MRTCMWTLLLSSFFVLALAILHQKGDPDHFLRFYFLLLVEIPKQYWLQDTLPVYIAFSTRQLFWLTGCFSFLSILSVLFLLFWSNLGIYRSYKILVTQHGLWRFMFLAHKNILRSLLHSWISVLSPCNFLMSPGSTCSLGNFRH